MTRKQTRREFVKNTALTGVGVWAMTSSARAWQSPNQKVNFACFGVDGKGASDSNDASRFGNVVAICDIDDNKLKKRQAGEDSPFADAKTFNDYRELLAEMGDKIDAVTVSTPDHMHAPISVKAMRMGKHCFCQKPLTHDVFEARLMRSLAKEKGLCSQMGNQGTANGALRRAVEVVQAGGIGEVTEAHVWTNRPIWPQGVGRPTGEFKVPANIHWDLWLGSAPERPYAPDTYHPFKWRGWFDFGTGALGDMACHTANMPFMALKLGYPVAMMAECSEFNEESFPKNSKITYEFPERDGMPPVKFHWYDGGNLPDKSLLDGRNPPRSGALLIGSKGKIFSGDDYCGKWEFLGDGFKDYKMPEKRLPDSPGHFKEFTMAIQEGKPELAMSNFDYAGFLTEVVVLGNVALRNHGKRLEWDGPGMKCTNVAEANKLVKREYRKGFGVEA